MKGQRHAPAALYPRERHGTHCTGGWVGHRAGLDRCGKSRPPPGFDPRTVQPVASRYTDYATQPTSIRGKHELLVTLLCVTTVLGYQKIIFTSNLRICSQRYVEYDTFRNNHRACQDSFSSTVSLTYRVMLYKQMFRDVMDKFQQRVLQTI